MNATTHWGIRATAIGIAFVAPILLLADQAPRRTVFAPPPAAESIPVAGATPEAATMAGLFEAPTPVVDATDRPVVVGIAGRLPDDAEAIVRMPGGQTQVIRRGDTVSGWTLIALAADRAVFANGDEQHVSTLAPLE